MIYYKGYEKSKRDLDVLLFCVTVMMSSCVKKVMCNLYGEL